MAQGDDKPTRDTEGSSPFRLRGAGCRTWLSVVLTCEPSFPLHLIPTISSSSDPGETDAIPPAQEEVTRLESSSPSGHSDRVTDGPPTQSGR